MLVDFGRKGYLAKARSQPDKVKQVLQKIKTDGIWTTIDAVRAKLETPIPLGYCNVGTVIDAPTRSDLMVGDRVVSNGPHAEIVSVPKNLVAKIPQAVSSEVAAYGVTSAIGLQGIRLLNPTLGERVVVAGLGLIGQLCVQILRANGCEVLGMDFDPKKLELARSFGARTVDLTSGEDPVRSSLHWTCGHGVDGVLITASTQSDVLMHQSADMCRKRGRIVLVGVAGLKLRRDDFYKKELSFQVSCSYGPGRYDPTYEKHGLDYPIGFVRWTEKRNFEAVLSLMERGLIQTETLTTHRFRFDDALGAYQTMNGQHAMGMLLEYDSTGNRPVQERTLTLQSTTSRAVRSDAVPRIGIIGAGSFTTRTLLPALTGNGVVREWIVSQRGVSAAHAANKFGFARCGTDVDALLDDSGVDAVFITTPHNTHADLVCAALERGKHVFVEKPLALNQDELTRVRECAEQHSGLSLMVGFNRRFSPHTESIVDGMKATPGSKAVIITVNAGSIPPEHWTQNRELGGGRILGEACHFIDLSRFLIARPITQVSSIAMLGGEGAQGDCASIHLKFEDGSIATIHYLANGNKSFPKERVEIFAGGQVHCIENFRRSRVLGQRRNLRTRRQDKGHHNEIQRFLDSLTEPTSPPIPLDELVEVSRITIEANDQIQSQLRAFTPSNLER
ncbi:bi-domain-containing oxidoreductase [Roseiconus nitratireducens]|nr:bi-domain-containing oxidoreductase [Roseiconus nitratireducens]